MISVIWASQCATDSFLSARSFTSSSNCWLRILKFSYKAVSWKAVLRHLWVLGTELRGAQTPLVKFDNSPYSMKRCLSPWFLTVHPAGHWIWKHQMFSPPAFAFPLLPALNRFRVQTFSSCLQTSQVPLVTTSLGFFFFFPWSENISRSSSFLNKILERISSP